MKIILSLICIIIAKTSFAQNDSIPVPKAAIPKKTSIIIVKHVSFDSIMAELDREGYSIENFVKNKIIVTKLQRVKGSLRSISFHIRYDNGTAQIIGTIFRYDSNQGGRTDPVIRPDPLFPKPFEAMNNFAIALKGEISYEE